LTRILLSADMFRKSPNSLIIRPERTFLRTDVVTPSVKQVELLLKSRRFLNKSIVYDRFEWLPPIWVDKNLFQHVFFCLLSNAIKYSYNDPQAFQVEILGR